MTEREYIIVADLRAARIAEQALHHVLPDNNPCVDQSGYRLVLTTIHKWISRMEKSREVEGIVE